MTKKILRFKGFIFKISTLLGIKDNPYYTHSNVLNSEMKKLKNEATIFEIGIGHGSSKIFHQYARSKNKWSIEAYETNNDWFNQISSKYQLINYRFTLLENYSQLLKWKIPTNIDLAFIDQEPWNSRLEVMLELAPYCSLFILHDFNYYVKYQSSSKKWDMRSLQELFPNFELIIYDEKYPGTLVLKKLITS